MVNNFWQLKNNDTDEVIKFDQDMHWTDEFTWSKVAQTPPVYLLNGSVDVQQGVKKAGRPITISGDWVWHNRGDLEILRDWSDTPELEMTLTHYDKREFNVIFRLHEAALGAEPVLYLTPEVKTDKYKATLNLMEI